MSNITPLTRNIILYSGLALLALGAALFFLTRTHFDQLQNYQKVAVFLPAFYGVTMLHVDTYRDLGAYLSSTNARPRGKAIGLLLVVPLLTIYCAAAWVLDVAG